MGIAKNNRWICGAWFYWPQEWMHSAQSGHNRRETPAQFGFLGHSRRKAQPHLNEDGRCTRDNPLSWRISSPLCRILKTNKTGRNSVWKKKRINNPNREIGHRANGTRRKKSLRMFWAAIRASRRTAKNRNRMRMIYKPSKRRSAQTIGAGRFFCFFVAERIGWHENIEWCHLFGHPSGVICILQVEDAHR